VKAVPSSEHWKVEPVSLELKVKVALRLEVEAFGLASILVSGGVVSAGGFSTVQLWVTGVASTFPDGSVALTLKEWAPKLRLLSWTGDAQGVKAAVSRAHWKEEPASLALKLN
jgi:hypothetical protein